MNTPYWTHNTAYHKWILKQIKICDRVLDVGCGDGLLVQKLSQVCTYVTGIEPHAPSAECAQVRTNHADNVSIRNISFEGFSAAPNTFDVIIFVASLHHMDLEYALKKSTELLAPHGRLLIVGCAQPKGFVDWFIECLRIIPARIGSLIHGEKHGGNIGVPVQQPSLSLRQIRNVSSVYLPGAKFRHGLYYRYLLTWIK